jgi:hypothetical protein
MGLRLGWLPRYNLHCGQCRCNRLWGGNLRFFTCNGHFRYGVLPPALHKDREDAGCIFDHGRPAAIGRAQAIAPNQFHAEALPAWLVLAKRLFCDPHLQPGQIRQLSGQPRLTVRIGKHFRAIELVVQVSLVIAAKQYYM